jgi:uncharacterized protein
MIHPRLADEGVFELPLFPLQSVLFPDGLLGLKVFEARYLDLVGSCLRQGSGFGVVAIRKGTEVRQPGDSGAGAEFERVGCVAEIIDVDSTQPGILQLRCRGTRRFETLSTAQQADGLWVAQVREVEADASVLPAPTLVGSAQGLANAIQALKQQGAEPFLAPYNFESAGWLANRWCEILPIPLAAKQKLMELDDPQVRLQLVDEFLRSKGVVQ